MSIPTDTSPSAPSAPSTSGTPRSPSSFRQVLQDLRLASRALVRRPGFTCVAAITLALGIGANSAIFTVLHGVLLAPLPYPEPDRLARIWTQFPEDGRLRFAASAAEFLDYRDETRAFHQVAAWTCGNVVLSGEGTPERHGACGATAELWPVLGVSAAAGRLFEPADDLPGAEPVVLLSHGLWQRRYDGSPSVIGRRLRVDGSPATILGVLPEGFALQPAADVWAPLGLDRATLQERSGHFLQVVGRLAPGATLDEARAEALAITSRWERLYDHAHPMSAEPFAEDFVRGARAPLWMLAGAVGLVLLIACANVAGLLLARGEARRREMAVRAALGASPGRLLSQVLAESVLLAFTGGALGLLLGAWGVEALVTTLGGALPRATEIGVGGAVLAFTCIVSLLTALVFGLLPGLRAARVGLAGDLRSSGRAGSRSRLRSALVVAEVALAVVLVVGSGLLLRSLWNLLDVDPGFDSEGVVAARLELPSARYPEREDLVPFFPRLVERLDALPGVAEVAVTTSLPLAQDLRPEGFRRLDRDRPAGQEPASMGYVAVSPGYFRTLRIPLRGRDFTEADRPGAPRVAIVDEALARAHFPGEDPVGQRIQILASRPDDVPFEIVGVAGEIRHEELGKEPQPTIYVPHGQLIEHGFRPPRSAVVALRAEGAGGSTLDLTAALRLEVARLDPELAISDLGSLDALRRTSVAQPRLLAGLLGAFSLLALVLAAVGLYGLMAQVVGQRRREMGVRMALGAGRGTVVRGVIAQGLRLTVAGLALGWVASLATGRVLSGQLFGVGAIDPVSLAATGSLLLLVALAACWLPARQAARVQPAEVLRSE